MRSTAVNIEADDSMVIGGGIGPGLATEAKANCEPVAVVVRKPGAAKVAARGLRRAVRHARFRGCRGSRKSKNPPAFRRRPYWSMPRCTGYPSFDAVHGHRERRVHQARPGRDRRARRNRQRLANGDSEFCSNSAKKTRSAATVACYCPTTQSGGPVRSTIHCATPARSIPNSPCSPSEARIKAARRRLQPFDPHHRRTQAGVTRQAFTASPQELETQLGCPVEFLEGASGSTHNITGISPDEAVRRMKKAITEALDQATPHAVTKLVSIKRPFSFKVRTFDESVEDEKVSRLPQANS